MNQAVAEAAPQNVHSFMEETKGDVRAVWFGQCPLLKNLHHEGGWVCSKDGIDTEGEKMPQNRDIDICRR